MVFMILHVLVYAAVVVRILSRTGLNPSVRVLWILLMLILPVAGIVLYLVVGEVHFGGSALRRNRTAEKRLDRYVEGSGLPPDLARFGTASGFATSINGFGVTGGNRGELLDSPDGARERLIMDMDAAVSSIDVLYYIWLDDGTGGRVAAALERAAARGVRCRAVVDAVGSRAFLKSATWKRLAAAGVETGVTLPLEPLLVTMLSRRPDLRNHRKISVIDGRICHCGSQNCADPEFRVKPKFAPWVDIMLRFEGPVVRQMHLLFIKDWLTLGEHALTAADEALLETPASEHEGGFHAQVVGTGPVFSRNITAQLFARLIFEARREIIISTPYFVPGEMVCQALMGAAKSGVTVTLIVPRRNDSGFVARASRSYYPSLVAAGVSIHEFNGGLLHAKTLTVDGELTFVGSTNMDIRSFDLNFENDILFRDTELTGMVRQRQMEYLAAATPVEPSEVRSWSLAKRVWFNAFAVVGPVL